MDRDIAIIAIGDEVLHGYTQNTNASCIAEELFQRGYTPIRQVVVSDDPGDIVDAIAHELRAHRDVITTGGLGPTIDDHTKSAVAQLFVRPLLHHDELFSELVLRYGEHYPTVEQQAVQPKGAVLLSNREGTAPGILLEDDQLFPGARLFVLPGPTHEMKDVFFREVLPRFFPQKDTQCRLFRLVGIKEHEVDPVLRTLQQRHASLRVGIYPSYELVRVHLSVADAAESPSLESAATSFQELFGRHLLSADEPTIESSVLRLLRSRGWKIATAESCTGGGIVARLTSVPGASSVVSGGIVAYQDLVKESLLGVPVDLIATHGAVSTEVTESMARRAQALFGVEVVCAVSGFFGPSGGTKEAPIGTVCASFLLPGRATSERLSFHGSREAICEKTVQAILAKLLLEAQAS